MAHRQPYQRLWAKLKHEQNIQPLITSNHSNQKPIIQHLQYIVFRNWAFFPLR